MVLLRGGNYDYSGEVSCKLTQLAGKGSTVLQVSNTIGFSTDYIVIAPKTIYAEIVLISAVTDNSKLTVGALKFNHNEDEQVFRLPYNQIKFYECATIDGTYTAVTGGLLDMNYADNYTNKSYPLGNKAWFFKRTFYNVTTLVESSITLVDGWQTNDEELYVTEQEMRSFLQFETDDYPTTPDIRFFIKLSMKRIGLDLATSNDNVLFIATLLLTKFYLLRGLATRSVSKGYIQVVAEGRTITKAYQEFVLESENIYQEYKEFILANGRREATATNYMNDNTIIDDWTRQEIIDNMNGTTNAENAQAGYKYSAFGGRRS